MSRAVAGFCARGTADAPSAGPPGAPGFPKFGWRRAPLAAFLGLLSASGCDGPPSSQWEGEQVCTVGIPAFGTGEQVVTASLALRPDVTRDASGVRFRNFTLGPVAGFACSAEEVRASYSGARGATDLLAVERFECDANDGRVYWVEGTGASDLEALFLTQTVDVWLNGGQSLLVCTTALRLVAPDAADAAAPPAAPDSGPSAPGIVAALPDAGDAAAP
jgi:hypothetical protein